MCVCVYYNMPRRVVTVGRGEDDGDGGDRSRVAGLAGAPLTSRRRFDRRRHYAARADRTKLPDLWAIYFYYLFGFV